MFSSDSKTCLRASHYSAFGLAFTASHNQREWNGLKVFNGGGSLLLTEETNRIEDEINGLTTDDM